MRLNICDDEDIVSDILLVNNGGETLRQSDPTLADSSSPGTSRSLSLFPLLITSWYLSLQVKNILLHFCNQSSYCRPLFCWETLKIYIFFHDKYLTLLKGTNCLNSWLKTAGGQEVPFIFSFLWCLHWVWLTECSQVSLAQLRTVQITFTYFHHFFPC